MELAQEIRRRIFWGGLISNGSGALVAFVFLAFVSPIDTDIDVGRQRLINIAVFAVWLPLTLAIGTVVSQRHLRPVLGWLRAGCPSDEAMRGRALRLPGYLAGLSAAIWLASAVVFAAVNAAAAPELGVLVAVGVTLGAVSTTALGHLLAERRLRPVTEAALAGAAPSEPRGVGIGRRLLMAWALGTGTALLGIVGITLLAVVSDTVDRDQLAGAALFLALLALGAGLVAIRLAARSVAEPLTTVRRALGEVERGDFDVQVPVDDGSEIGFLEAGFNRMATGLGERERLRDAFGTFVDPNLTERVLREGTDLAGEEVELSVLFMDVRGFTTYAEQASAQDVVAALNDLYATVVPIIARHGGHANKFIGDGLLAVFGAPQRLDDHAERAVAAALEIAGAVAERHANGLRVGVGVNSGPVVAGTVGGGGRLDFTVIGDVVNTAARVEAATRATGDDVLITDSTLALLSGDGTRWAERPAIELKGKSRAVALYAPAQEAVAGPQTSR
jgi:adenylate cyclase